MSLLTKLERLLGRFCGPESHALSDHRPGPHLGPGVDGRFQHRAHRAAPPSRSSPAKRAARDLPVRAAKPEHRRALARVHAFRLVCVLSHGQRPRTLLGGFSLQRIPRARLVADRRRRLLPRRGFMLPTPFWPGASFSPSPTSIRIRTADFFPSSGQDQVAGPDQWLFYAFYLAVGSWSVRLAVLAATGNFLLFFAGEIANRIRTRPPADDAPGPTSSPPAPTTGSSAMRSMLKPAINARTQMRTWPMIR